jgi:toxin FitB
VNVVDSPCWLEYFAGSVAAKRYAAAIENADALVVPAITLYEVFKKIYTVVGEAEALLAIAHMRQGKVVDVDARLALAAARLGCELKLPLADSLIYATARDRGATLWTQDEHFAGLHGVRYFPA